LLCIFWRWGSLELFAQADFKSWSSSISVSQIARITGVSHQCLAALKIFFATSLERCFSSITKNSQFGFLGWKEQRMPLISHLIPIVQWVIMHNSISVIMLTRSHLARLKWCGRMFLMLSFNVVQKFTFQRFMSSGRIPSCCSAL
jgi:hypothetical protein